MSFKDPTENQTISDAACSICEKKANPEGLAFSRDSILDKNNLQRRRD
jgi:hypothetical protein